MLWPYMPKLQVCQSLKKRTEAQQLILMNAKTVIIFADRTPFHYLHQTEQLLNGMSRIEREKRAVAILRSN